MTAPRRTVVILIDALGFDLAEHYGMYPDDLPVRVRLETVLGFSQAALTSIVTGLYPHAHGLWMMYSFNAMSSPFRWMKALPKSVSAERLWLRRLIRWKLESVNDVKSYYSLYHVPRHVFPYLDLPARNNLFVPGGAGGARTIFDEIEGRKLRTFIRDYHTPEEIAFDDLERALEKREASFYFLYTAGLDGLLHRHGSGDGRVPQLLEWYGQRIKRVVERARAGGIESDIHVLGDHGMCEVTSHIDILSKVNTLGLSIPDDYIPFYDSTMARFRVASARAGHSIAALLSNVEGGRILSSEELEHLGVFFPDGRFGDLVFLADPGAIILPSYMGQQAVAAMHGYHPSASCMSSVLFSNREMGSTDHWSICDLAQVLFPGFVPGRERGAQ